MRRPRRPPAGAGASGQRNWGWRSKGLPRRGGARAAGRVQPGPPDPPRGCLPGTGVPWSVVLSCGDLEYPVRSRCRKVRSPRRGHRPSSGSTRLVPRPAPREKVSTTGSPWDGHARRPRRVRIRRPDHGGAEAWREPESPRRIRARARAGPPLRAVRACRAGNCRGRAGYPYAPEPAFRGVPARAFRAVPARAARGLSRRAGVPLRAGALPPASPFGYPYEPAGRPL